MSDILFVLKVLLLTVVLVLVMQIKVGEATIERYSQNWIRTSSLVSPLQGVAHGAVKAITQAHRFISGSVDTSVGKVFHRDNSPGERGLGNALRKKQKAPAPQEVTKEVTPEPTEAVEVRDLDDPTSY